MEIVFFKKLHPGKSYLLWWLGFLNFCHTQIQKVLFRIVTSKSSISSRISLLMNNSLTLPFWVWDTNRVNAYGQICPVLNAWCTTNMYSKHYAREQIIELPLEQLWEKYIKEYLMSYYFLVITSFGHIMN